MLISKFYRYDNSNEILRIFSPRNGASCVEKQHFCGTKQKKKSLPEKNVVINFFDFTH
jgi:hypothetical protein